MTDKQPTIWDLEPHTGAKHHILRKYLGAWFPKLRWRGRVVFIDGFAGPGTYKGGEPGSPLIALDAAITHKSDLSDCNLVYLFIERDKQRFDHLDKLIRGLSTPSHVSCQAIHGEFALVVGKLLDDLEEGGKILAPTLVMVDPFGFSGMPMSLMSRLGTYGKTELLISFMYESLNRWLSQPPLAATIDELYGCSEWRDANKMVNASERKEFLRSLYIRQLRDRAGMEYVRAFEMMDKGNHTEYFLIFATHHIEGLKAMKAAMWAVDPKGTYQFSDATNPSQLTLFGQGPDYGSLKALIVGRFSGKDVSVSVLERFIVADTAFRETHYKRGILRPMEQAGEIDVVESPRKKRYTYPPGTVIRFP